MDKLTDVLGSKFVENRYELSKINVFLMKNNNSRPLGIDFSKIGSLETHIRLNLEVSISNYLTELEKLSNDGVIMRKCHFRMIDHFRMITLSFIIHCTAFETLSHFSLVTTLMKGLLCFDILRISGFGIFLEIIVEFPI